MAIDPSLIAKVEAALRTAMREGKDLAPSIRLEEAAGRVAGHVLSDSLGALSPSARQDLIWKHLDAALTPYERTRISFIVTDTPDEHRVLTGS